MPEEKIKRHLIEVASINAESTILDFGCGTGTLTIMVKETAPGANVTGIDIDAEILKKAIDKAREKEIEVL